MLRTFFLSLSMIGFFSLNAESPQSKEIQAVKQEVKDVQTERHAIYKFMAGTMQAFEKHHFILSVLPTVASIGIPALIRKPLDEPLKVAISVYTTSVVTSRYLLPSVMDQLNIKKI